MAKIATIIPFYNGAKYLDRCLRSISNQSVSSNEVIIVDDGSTSKESTACKAIVKKYGFKYVYKENGGQGSARNFGVKESSEDTELICLLDQDDFYLPNHNLILLKEADVADAEWGFSYANLYEADGNGDIIHHNMLGKHGSHPKHNLFDLIREDMFILPSASIIRKSAFIDVGGFDEQFTGYEDDDFFMRLFMRGWRHTCTLMPVTVWCINEESTSYSVKMSISRKKYFDKLIGRFQDNPKKNRFFYRDLMHERFSKLFVFDYIKSKFNENPNKEVTEKIFRDFVYIFNNNVAFPWSRKMKLNFIYRMIIILPAPLLKIIFRMKYGRTI